MKRQKPPEHFSMKKLPAIFFICCLLVPYTGFMFLQYQKAMVHKEVKQQMIAGIGKEELVLLRFTLVESETNLRWEHSGEFEFHDEMYDVVVSETRGDSIFYWCWWDRKETKLNMQLDNLIAQTMERDPQQKGQQQRLFNFFQDFPQFTYSDKNTEPKYTQLLLSVYTVSNYSAILQPPPDPPPRKT